MAARPRFSGLDGFVLRKLLIFVFFLGYFTVATGGMLMTERREVFPVFSWSLFTNVNQYLWTYEIAISRVDDTVYDPPVDYFTLSNMFADARNRESAVVKTARAYHWAKNNDPSRLESLRSVIEGRYLAGYDRVDYTIQLVLHQPLLRWQTGAVERRDVIEELSKVTAR